jgi:hypothetical protein
MEQIYFHCSSCLVSKPKTVTNEKRVSKRVDLKDIWDSNPITLILSDNSCFNCENTIRNNLYSKCLNKNNYRGKFADNKWHIYNIDLIKTYGYFCAYSDEFLQLDFQSWRWVAISSDYFYKNLIQPGSILRLHHDVNCENILLELEENSLTMKLCGSPNERDYYYLIKQKPLLTKPAKK